MGDAIAQVLGLGRTLVIAPHPDDETLGCGGLLALLAHAGLPVRVVLVSDGAASHPSSASHPAARLRALRLGEMAQALQALGLNPACLVAMGLPDGALPTPGDAMFEPTAHRLALEVAAFRPDTVLMPWRHDGHPDHRASHALTWAACDETAPRTRRLEYEVWTPAQAPARDVGGADVWCIWIGPVLERKRRALDAHRSQQGMVITDDPSGFELPPALVARCALPTETYIDTTRWSTP